MDLLIWSGIHTTANTVAFCFPGKPPLLYPRGKFEFKFIISRLVRRLHWCDLRIRGESQSSCHKIGCSYFQKADRVLNLKWRNRKLQSINPCEMARYRCEVIEMAGDDEICLIWPDNGPTLETLLSRYSPIPGSGGEAHYKSCGARSITSRHFVKACVIVTSLAVPPHPRNKSLVPRCPSVVLKSLMIIRGFNYLISASFWIWSMRKNEAFANKNHLFLTYRTAHSQSLRFFSLDLNEPYEPHA